jgi:MFS transporter
LVEPWTVGHPWTAGGTDGWGSATVVALLAISAVLLVLFVVHEATASAPLLPLRIVRNRNRGGSYIAVGCAVAAMLGVFLLLTYDFQVVLHYSPVRAGLAFLPLSAVVLFSSGAIASPLLPRVPPRVLMVPGLLVAAGGMLVLTTLTVDSNYAVHILPAEILLGLGMGCVFVPAFSTATQGVDPREAGVASATANTAQQVGGSLGTALLNTIAASATTSYLTSGPAGSVTAAAALVHGYAVATAWGAGILGVAAVLVVILVNAGRPVAHSAAQPDQAQRGGAQPAATQPSYEPLITARSDGEVVPSSLVTK